MKKQLRNIAFATAILACGTAMAQQVLEPAWQQVVTASGGGNIRYGQGFGGKVYMSDKGDNTIKVADGTTVTNYVEDSRITGIALTIDQVGNIVVNTHFPDAPSGSNFLLINKDTKAISEINLSEDEMATPGRLDEMGRAIGDFTSEQGGVFYVCPNSLDAVYAVNIINGALNYEEFGFAASDAIGATNSTTCIAQPRFNSIAEMYQAVEDGVVPSASDAFYYRNRGNKYISEFAEVDGENKFTTWVSFNAKYTTDGFDWFELQGKKYIVVPNNTAAAHTNQYQVVCVTDDKVVAISNLTEASQAFQQYSVEKVSETKVNIYTVTYVGANVYCSCTPFEIPAVHFDNTESNWEKVYAYTWNGNDKNAEWPGVELTNPVNNVYTYAYPEGMVNIIFNNGNGGEGNQTADLTIVQGKTYTASSVNPMEAPEHLYLIGHMPEHSWDPSYTGAELTKTADGIFEINGATIAPDGYFQFISKTGTWEEVDSGNNRFGALTSDAPVATGETVEFAMNQNSWYITPGTYKFVMNFNEGTLTVSDFQGVEVVEAENAPAVYFNLQGQKVNNPANGLYIVKRGNKVAKEFVK